MASLRPERSRSPSKLKGSKASPCRAVTLWRRMVCNNSSLSVMSCGKGRSAAVGQAHLLDQLLPQGVVSLAGQMVEPVVVADHVMGADQHGLIVGIRGGPGRAEHRRNGNLAFRGQGAERRERLLILREDIARDPGDLIDQARRLRIVPGTNAAGRPASGWSATGPARRPATPGRSVRSAGRRRRSARRR